MKQIILGSQSPRRKELMSLANIPCSVMAADIDELVPDYISPYEAPVFLSLQKAKVVRRKLSDQQQDGIIITSDTIVVCDNQVLGKPEDNHNAVRMLQMLSGKTHQVITGVTIQDTVLEFSHTSIVDVTFKELTAAEIGYYVSTYKPFDKAGSYAIQEWIGAIGITSIKGDYYSVMGLPVQWVYSVLKENFNFTSFTT